MLEKLHEAGGLEPRIAALFRDKGGAQTSFRDACHGDHRVESNRVLVVRKFDSG